MSMKQIPTNIATLLACATALYAQSSYERDLSALDEQRNNAIAAAIEPIDRRYQASLEQLMQRATLNKDLDTALKIKEKLAALTKQASKADAIVGQWQEVQGTVTVLADGTARHSNGAAATWQIKNGNFVFTWSNDANHVFPSSGTGETMRGTITHTTGKSQPWTWNRMH